MSPKVRENLTEEAEEAHDRITTAIFHIQSKAVKVAMKKKSKRRK